MEMMKGSRRMVTLEIKRAVLVVVARPPRMTIEYHREDLYPEGAGPAGLRPEKSMGAIMRKSIRRSKPYHLAGNKECTKGTPIM